VKINMPIFGGELRPASEWFDIGWSYPEDLISPDPGVTWVQTAANLCYCPSYGFAKSITAFIQGTMYAADGTPLWIGSYPGVARAAILKPKTPPVDAPYWDASLGAGEHIFIYPEDVVAVSNVIGDITARQYATFSISASLSPGYYLLAIVGNQTTIYGCVPEDWKNNKAAKFDDGALAVPEFEFPHAETGIDFCPDYLTNFPRNFAIYCTYELGKGAFILNLISLKAKVK
jgi:hypothetical protein